MSKQKICELCRKIGKWCEWPVKTANFVFGLLFLPTRWRRWLFGTGTRALKVLNVCLLGGWAAMMLSGGYHILPTYAGFRTMPLLPSLSFLLLPMGLMLWSMYDVSPRGRHIGGVGLMLCGGVWALVAATFIAGYPPLHTGMTVYPVLGLMSVLAGDHMRDEARAEKGGA